LVLLFIHILSKVLIFNTLNPLLNLAIFSGIHLANIGIKQLYPIQQSSGYKQESLSYEDKTQNHDVELVIPLLGSNIGMEPAGQNIDL